MLNAEDVWALFEKLSTSKRENEEHGLKENSRTVEIDVLTRKFQGMSHSKWDASSGAGNPSTAIRWKENAHDQQRCYPQQASK
jgi:hypothetical protein